MASSLFQIKEHTVPGQHIRNYPHAINGEQEHVLYLSVKQYTPLSNLIPEHGDITIIGAHANAFPKELYEPLWDDILQMSGKSGFRIRNIWIADVSHQGQSGVLNESKLGNDPSWFDHPRDLLHIINHFRSEMPRPFFGIGHSMGGNNLVNLSLLHPRLFQSLILVDPVIQRFLYSYPPAVASSGRRDRWPSRAEACKAFLRSKYYAAWDSRVMDKWVEHGLRELPTALHPDPQPAQLAPPMTSDGAAIPTTQPDKEVTLRTTKHNEVMTFVRHSPRQRDPASSRLVHFEQQNENMTFYRPESDITHNNLPYVRPSVLYVFGETSYVSSRDLREAKLASTGTGLGGSGGARAGRVKEVVLKDVGHLIPMEKVAETARVCVEWIEREMKQWRDDEKDLARLWAEVPKGYENKLSPAFIHDLRAGAPATPKSNWTSSGEDVGKGKQGTSKL